MDHRDPLPVRYFAGMPRLRLWDLAAVTFGRRLYTLAS
jgi:hypothetical protein